MAQPPFIQLNPGRQNAGPPPGGRPPGPPHMAAPRGPPAPPRDMLPPDLRQGRTVEVSDVSEDLMSEADMRSRLTEYVAFRFEKMPQRSLYNEDGELEIPTWDRAVRTQMTSMSQRQIAREIKHLDQTSHPVIEKKATLGAALQRQIDKAQERLVAHEGHNYLMNYQWVLAQIDHQLREIQPPLVVRGRVCSTTRLLRSNCARKRTVCAPHGHKKRRYERVSLTAYFRREPRQNVNIQLLWDQKRMQTMHGNQPWPPPQQPGPPGNTGGPPRNPPPPPPPPGGGGGGGQTGSVPPRVSGGGGGGGGGNPIQPPAYDSGSDSDSSSSSSSSKSTLPSSVTSGSCSSHHGHRGHRNRSRGRSQGRRRDGGKHHHGKRGRRVYIEGGPPPPPFHGMVMPPPPPPPPMPPPHPVPPVSPPGPIDRITADAFRAGRQAERADALEADRARRLRPRVVQPGAGRPPRPMVRTFSLDPDDFRRRGRRMESEDELPPLDALSLSDEYDSDYRREAARRQREYNYRMQDGSIMSDDPFAREPPYRRRGRGGSADYDNPHVTEIPYSPHARYRGGERPYRPYP